MVATSSGGAFVKHCRSASAATEKGSRRRCSCAGACVLDSIRLWRSYVQYRSIALLTVGFKLHFDSRNNRSTSLYTCKHTHSSCEHCRLSLCAIGDIQQQQQHHHSYTTAPHRKQCEAQSGSEVNPEHKAWLKRQTRPRWRRRSLCGGV